MKIVYVAKKYNQRKGRPVIGSFSYAHCNLYGSLTKIYGGRINVIYFPFDEITYREGKEAMNRKLLKIVDLEKPDLVFFVINLIDTTALEAATIEKISQKTITLNWFIDDHWQFDKFSKYWVKKFTWATAVDSQVISKFHKIGYFNVIKTQWAWDPFFYQPPKLSKIYDVSFVGQAHGNRKRIVKKIEREGIKVNCWGSGWDKGPVSQKEMLDIFAQTKININFSRCRYSYLKFLPEIFLRRNYDGSLKLVHPKYWLDNLKSNINTFIRTQIKAKGF